MDLLLRRAKIGRKVGPKEWPSPYVRIPTGDGVDVRIIQRENSFLLCWISFDSVHTGQHAYPELKFAEHAAEELFGISASDWDSLDPENGGRDRR